jgi:hypothetical protein
MLRGEGSLEDILGLQLSDELIIQIDKSGDGVVTKDEWLRAMIIALGKADEDLCDLIIEHFDNLVRCAFFDRNLRSRMPLRCST